jgi:small subunit ribosomal protein S21
MLVINVNDEKGLESAIKLYKSKVQKTKQVQELKNRQEFIKPSIKKRHKHLKAVFLEQIKNGLS